MIKMLKYIFYIMSVDLYFPPHTTFNGVLHFTLATDWVIMLFFNSFFKEQELLISYIGIEGIQNSPCLNRFVFYIFILITFGFYSICFYGNKRGEKIIEEYKKKGIKHKILLHFLFVLIWIAIPFCIFLSISKLIYQ